MVDLIERVTWTEVEETILANPDLTFGLNGPPGLGKTSFCFALAEALEKQYVGKIQCQDELSPAEMMGVLAPGEKGSVWVPGPVDLAYKFGGLLVLDEIDKLSGPCKTQAYSLLDKGPGGTISYLGRNFEQAEGYQVLATTNEDPNSGILPDALLDRFDAWFLISEPSDRLMELLDDDLQMLCRRGYRRAADPMIGPAFTFRNYISLQQLRQTMRLDKAVLSICRGNQELARTVFEALTIAGDTDDEDE